MTAMTPEQRRLRAQVAAHARWAKERDRKAATAAARAAKTRKFEDEARLLAPEGASEQEIAERAHHLFLADQKRLALKSVKARQRKAVNDDSSAA